MRAIFLSTLLLLTASLAGAVGPHTFSLGGDEFLLDGKPFQIIGGQMHHARIPAEYWRHRIRMAKAMGCNTIAAYVFWSYHETAEGTFDFTTGNRDFGLLPRIAREEGMWVLLRPGPYACAGWDSGGLPAYPPRIPDLKIRCLDPRYMAAGERYIRALARVVNPPLAGERRRSHPDGPDRERVWQLRERSRLSRAPARNLARLGHPRAVLHFRRRYRPHARGRDAARRRGRPGPRREARAVRTGPQDEPGRTGVFQRILSRPADPLG
jgi:hypothetical protein